MMSKRESFTLYNVSCIVESLNMQEFYNISMKSFSFKNFVIERYKNCCQVSPWAPCFSKIIKKGPNFRVH